MSAPGRKGEFTGRHMLVIMIAFFGIIIAINVTMAVMAQKSWTGVVAENTHVSSRQFNAQVAEARTQRALGWSSELVISDGVITYRLNDAENNPVRARSAVAYFRRPVHESADQQVTMAAQADGALTARADLGDGLWNVVIETEAGLERPYRETRRVTLQDGATRQNAGKKMR